MDRFKWFKMFSLSIFWLFMSVLIYVTVSAYSKKSGNTGMDMGKIHLQYIRANQERVGQ